MAELINTRPPPAYWRGEITRAIQSRKVMDQSLQHMLDQLATLDQTTAIVNLAQRIFDEQKKNRQWIDRYEPMLTLQDDPMMHAFMQFADNRNLFAIPNAMVDCLFKEKEEWMERMRHDRMFKELREQNDYMKRLLSEQAKQMDQLKKQVGKLTETTSQMDHEIEQLKNDRDTLMIHKVVVDSLDLKKTIQTLGRQQDEFVKTLMPLTKPAVVEVWSNEASTLHGDVQLLKDEVVAIKEAVEELRPKRYHTRSKARAQTEE
jgi:hypothetical protein